MTCRSDVDTTREDALDEIIELSFEDDYLRNVLKTSDGIRSIGLLRSKREIWYNLPMPIRTKAERAIFALADINAAVKDLIVNLQSNTSLQHWPKVRQVLRDFLLYVYSTKLLSCSNLSCSSVGIHGSTLSFSVMSGASVSAHQMRRTSSSFVY